jgi:hypothetical protein
MRNNQTISRTGCPRRRLGGTARRSTRFLKIPAARRRSQRAAALAAARDGRPHRFKPRVAPASMRAAILREKRDVLERSARRLLREPARESRYRGSALIPTDCDALAYQAAALNDTVRLTRAVFLRPVFPDRVWRLMVLALLTHVPPKSPGTRRIVIVDVLGSPEASTPISHRQARLVKAPRSLWSKQSEGHGNDLNHLAFGYFCRYGADISRMETAGIRRGVRLDTRRRKCVQPVEFAPAFPTDSALARE